MKCSVRSRRHTYTCLHSMEIPDVDFERGVSMIKIDAQAMATLRYAHLYLCVCVQLGECVGVCVGGWVGG